MSLVGQLQSAHTGRDPESFSAAELGDTARKYKWESGSIDYLGQFSFSFWLAFMQELKMQISLKCALAILYANLSKVATTTLTV